MRIVPPFFLVQNQSCPFVHLLSFMYFWSRVLILIYDQLNRLFLFWSLLMFLLIQPTILHVLLITHVEPYLWSAKSFMFFLIPKNVFFIQPGMGATPTLLTNGLQKMFFWSLINVFFWSLKMFFFWFFSHGKLGFKSIQDRMEKKPLLPLQQRGGADYTRLLPISRRSGKVHFSWCGPQSWKEREAAGNRCQYKIGLYAWLCKGHSSCAWRHKGGHDCTSCTTVHIAAVCGTGCWSFESEGNPRRSFMDGLALSCRSINRHHRTASLTSLTSPSASPQHQGAWVLIWRRGYGIWCGWVPIGKIFEDWNWGFDPINRSGKGKGYGQQRPIFQQAVECWNCGQYGHKSFECRSGWSRRQDWGSSGSYSSRSGGQGNWGRWNWRQGYQGQGWADDWGRSKASSSTAPPPEPAQPPSTAAPMPDSTANTAPDPAQLRQRRGHSRDHACRSWSAKSTARSMACRTSSAPSMTAR